MKHSRGFLWLELALLLPILFLFIAALVKVRVEGYQRLHWSATRLEMLVSSLPLHSTRCEQGPETHIFPANQRVYWRLRAASPGGQLGFDCPKKTDASTDP